jgi:eukaryotic-like serine/threonine-protein kinase
MMKVTVPCLLIALTLLIGCNKPANTPSPPTGSAEKKITSFIFTASSNPSLQSDVFGTISADSIKVILPFGTPLTNLVPTINISGASISPAGLVKLDFSSPVTYMVRAKDSTIHTYTVVVNTASVNATVFINFTGYDNTTGDGIAELKALDANTGKLQWQYTMPTKSVILTSPAFFNGGVYICVGNCIYCIDTTTKNNKWTFTTGGFLRSTPTILSGILYINSDDGNLYAIDASTGLLKWKYFEASGSVYGPGNGSGPTVVDGVVYVGGFDVYLYAVDANTGILKWKFFDSYDNGLTIEASPSVVDGTVYFSGAYNFFALKADDGTLVWKANSSGPSSSPTVANGVVYFGSTDQNIYALDAKTGSVLWNYYAQFQIAGTPCLSSGIVFDGAGGPNSSAFFALDAVTGKIKWQYGYDYSMGSSPLVFNNIVYVVGIADVLALDVTTGTLKWKYAIDNQYQDVETSPCIVDKNGNIYYPGISGSQN